MISMFKALLIVLFIANCGYASARGFPNRRLPPEDLWDNIEMMVCLAKVGQLFGRFAIAFGIRGILSLMAIFGMTIVIIDFVPPIKRFCIEISRKSYQKARIIIMTWLLLRH